MEHHSPSPRTSPMRSINVTSMFRDVPDFHAPLTYRRNRFSHTFSAGVQTEILCHDSRIKWGSRIAQISPMNFSLFFLSVFFLIYFFVSSRSSITVYYRTGVVLLTSVVWVVPCNLLFESCLFLFEIQNTFWEDEITLRPPSFYVIFSFSREEFLLFIYPSTKWD